MGGISAILGAIALLGFLVFLAGVGLVVVAASQGRPVRNGILLAIGGLVFGVLLSVISQGVIVVQPQEIGVVFQTVSGELETPRPSGTHIIIPVLQEATIYSIEGQQYTMSGTAREGSVSGDDAVRGRTEDGQEVSMDISILYRIDPQEVNTLHSRWRNRYEDDFIRPTARGVIRQVISGYVAAEIYGVERIEVEDQMQTEIAALMDQEGMELIDLLIRDITFTDEYSQAIEQAQIAQQQAERARLQVEQIRQEAEQRRAEAAGRRDAAILAAEGEAQAIILNAEAQAEALRLVSEQIAANPSLIQYEYIRSLAPNVNLALIPSNSPFLFDFDSISNLPEADPDFTAPEVPESEPVAPIPETGGEAEGEDN